MGKKREPKAATSGWLNTYADMITLCMCFFVMLYDPSEADVIQVQSMAAALNNEATGGGLSLSAGSLSDLGNTVNSLPSIEKGKSLGTKHALRDGVSQESRVGADRSVIQTFPFIPRHPSEQKIAKHHTSQLDTDRYDKDCPERMHGLPGKFNLKGPDDIAGEDQVQYQIRHIFLSLLPHDPDFLQNQTRQHQQKNGSL